MLRHTSGLVRTHGKRLLGLQQCIGKQATRHTCRKAELMEGHESDIDPLTCTQEEFTQFVYDRIGDRKFIRNMIGYPCNFKDLDALTPIRTALAPLLLDNCGDPFDLSGVTYSSQSLRLERMLVEMVGADWMAPENMSSLWGYCTTGGSEGNLSGVKLAYAKFKNNGKKVAGFYCVEAHYSVPKAFNIQAIKPTLEVKGHPDGSMDMEDLKQSIFAAKRTGCDAFIVVGTLGTTMKGGVDDFDEIHKIFADYKIDRDDYHIHMDGALFAGYWPHTDGRKYKLMKEIDSMSVSGHKWWGGSLCGLLMTSQELVDAGDTSYIEYVGFQDAAVSGSRNGKEPVTFISRIKQFDWAEELRGCWEVKQYAREQFHAKGYKFEASYNSIIGNVTKPHTHLLHKWQLASAGDESHIIFNPHVSKEIVDEYLVDFDKYGIFVEEADGIIVEPMKN